MAGRDNSFQKMLISVILSLWQCPYFDEQVVCVNLGHARSMALRKYMLRQRKHIRLRDFDYSSANAYFITVCVKDFQLLLGTIRNGICGLSEIGSDVAMRLQNIPALYKDVELDEFMVMPNHFHVMIIIAKHHGEYVGNAFQNPRGGSVSMMINAAKGATTKWCQKNNLCFDWQDKFYDHVIRNAEEYWTIKNYIINNPRNWKEDRFHL